MTDQDRRDAAPNCALRTGCVKRHHQCAEVGYCLAQTNAAGQVETVENHVSDLSIPPVPAAPPDAAPNDAELKPVCYRREWDGDDSDLGQFVHADVDELSGKAELDNHGVWE